MPDIINQAAHDIIAQIQNPLTAEQKQVMERTLVRLQTLTASAIIAPADEIEQIKSDAKADLATLASIADAAGAEAVNLFRDRVVQIVSGIIGTGLAIV